MVYMKRYFKIKCPVMPMQNLSTKAKKMIYESLKKYNNTLLLATREELYTFLNKVINELESQKHNYRKWPTIYCTDGSSRISYAETPVVICDGFWFVITEELKEISLTDYNPFKLNIECNMD